ncbi:unnamed protein product [Prorocentrum cordatum]|uniref:EF-hand domain-containing protein n=1 Tax=Prorocentrum cordatum TaxID=2364126 RepID=A0ABN9Q5B8_9DINO|nr:unnamed protein product [Polarella glacialis]
MTVGPRSGPPPPSPPSSPGAEGHALAELRGLCGGIDADGSGCISRLELVEAVQRCPAVAALVLPGADGARVLEDEATFDALGAAFEAIARGRQRIRVDDFVRRPTFWGARQRKGPDGVDEVRRAFDLADSDGDGTVSRLELLGAVKRHPQALPGFDASRVMSDQDAFDAVHRVFDAVAAGKRRIGFADFQSYFGGTRAGQVALECGGVGGCRHRGDTRVFLLDPTGLHRFSVAQAGFSVHWCAGPPSPHSWAAPAVQQLHAIGAEIDSVQPHVLACASQASDCVYALWQAGLWRGPTVLINPRTVCRQLPADVPVVLIHGGSDAKSGVPRPELERLVAASSGGARGGFLFLVDPSTFCGSALLKSDCLPRLLEGAASPDGPEAHILRTVRERKSAERWGAELWLGHRIEDLRRRWASPGQRGRDARTLFEVPRGSEEFRMVAQVFKAEPAEASAYNVGRQGFASTTVLAVHRVENGLQADGCSRPYTDALSRSLEDQGVSFEPGVHTCWAFHGTRDIDSIVGNPMAGFQPLAAGLGSRALWGSGTYFARDAKYVADGGFDLTGGRTADGSRRMLMCLLATGMPCLGDPGHKGVLPFRRPPHRFHSAVDSVANPEIYVVQHPGAAHPAYVITFAAACL